MQTALSKDNYDGPFFARVHQARLLSVAEAEALKVAAESSEQGDLRVEYGDLNQYAELARRLGIMPDIKAGVPRAAYGGVVMLRTASGGTLFVAKTGS